jgi:hypothetical protein
VPLGDLNADKEWKVTAIPTGFKPQTKTVVARANQEVRADFDFSLTGNNKPVAVPETVEVNEDAVVQLALTASDADEDPLTFHVMTFPEHGVLVGNAPALSYRPDPNYNGPDSFEFIVNDGQDNSERATITLDVKPVNDDPAAFGDEFTRPAGIPARIPLAEILANDTDIDGDTLTVTQVFPWNGLVTAAIEGDELVVVAPAGSSQENVTYNISDGHGGSAGAVVVIRFVATPLAPLCADATFQGTADLTLDGQLSCTDPNGDAVTYSLVTGPDAGELSLEPDGSFTYTPPAGFTGQKSFTFRATDAGGLESEAYTATLVIHRVNAAPVAADASVTVAEDGSVSVPLGATDGDGDTLSFEVASQPQHGSLSGTAPALTYTPDENYHGVDSFTFRAADGIAESNVATVSITVTPVNDAPSAQAAQVSTPEDTPVELTLAGTDVDGDDLTVEVVGQPVYGTLVDRTYTPDPNYHGSDSVRFRVSDGEEADEALVAITVMPVNDAPVATDLTVLTPEDTPVQVPLVGQDGDGDTLTVQVLEGPGHGTLADGTYTPDDDYYGPDAVRFRVSDGTASDEGLATIDVMPVNDQPVCVALTLQTLLDTPVDAAPSCTDVEDEAVTYEVVQQGAKGEASLVGGLLHYQPIPGALGEDSFRYRGTDSEGAFGEAQVRITIAPAASPPPPAPPPPPPAPPSPPPPPPPPPPAPQPQPEPRRPQAVKRCKVPNVRGKTERQARRAIFRAGCRTVVVGRRYSLSYRPGRVIGQSVRPGRLVRRGTFVRIMLSRGTRPVRPPFTG